MARSLKLLQRFCVLSVFYYCFIPILIFSTANSQDMNEGLTLDKKSLMILPASKDNHKDVGDKITSLVADAATSIGRFEVIDRNLVEEILEEQSFQMSGMVSDDQIIKLGELAAAEEALIIEIVHFGQKGVPKPKPDEKEKKDQDDEKDETLFSWVVKKTVTAAIDNTNSEKEKRRIELENNIQTIITANVRLVNVETGISEKSFKLNATYTGGNRDASLEKALNYISYQIKGELKELYTITSEIFAVNGETISILSGENLGLRKGDYFEIASKDKQNIYKGRTVTLPGKSRGLAVITEVGPDASKAKIIRKWRKVKKGHRAYEMLGSPMIADINISYSPLPHYEMIGKIFINPFSPFSGSLNGLIGLVEDSRNDLDFYIGLGGTIDFKVLSGFGTTFSTSLDLPFSLVMTKDDKNHVVNSILIMPAVGLNLAIQIGKHRDLIFSIKNVLATNKQAWTYTVKTGEKDEDGNDETKQESADWVEDEPTINPTGMIFSISLRRYWF